MKKNKFKTNSNSKTKSENKKVSYKKTKTSKMAVKKNKSNSGDKSIRSNSNRSKSAKKPKTNTNISTNIKIDKKNMLLKEKKQVKIEKIIKKEKKNLKKKEEQKEKEIKKINKNNLSLTKKDLDLLLTSFNPQKTPSLKIKKNNSLNTSDFNEKIILKHLLNKKNDLHIELSKINKRNTYLKEISLNNLYNSNYLKKDQQMKLIKNLKQSKENLLDKVSSINQQIYQININHKNNSNMNDISKEEYCENLRKEFIFNNMRKWNKPRSSIKRRMKNLAFKKGDITNDSKVSQNQKENKKKDKSINSEKFLSKEKHKSFINNIIQKSRNKGYLYQNLASSFEAKEKIYITESIKPKNQQQIKQINKLDVKYNTIKRKISNLEQVDKLHKLWKERNELLPKYVSPLYKDIINTEKIEKQEEKEKQDKKKLLYELKKNYGKENVNLPKISFLLKREWDKKEIKFNLDKYKKHNNIINNNLNIRLIQLKNKNKSFSRNENQKNNSLLGISSKEKFNNLISKNKQQKKNSHSFITINNKLNLNNNINNIKNINNVSFHKSSIDNNKIEEVKKKKFTTIKINKKRDIHIDDIKYKIKIMEDKYKRGKELLKVKGGYINNEDFGDEMNELLINSIKGKLDMIEMAKSGKNNE